MHPQALSYLLKGGAVSYERGTPVLANLPTAEAVCVFALEMLEQRPTGVPRS